MRETRATNDDTLSWTVRTGLATGLHKSSVYYDSYTYESLGHESKRDIRRKVVPAETTLYDHPVRVFCITIPHNHSRHRGYDLFSHVQRRIFFFCCCFCYFFSFLLVPQFDRGSVHACHLRLEAACACIVSYPVQPCLLRVLEKERKIFRDS